MKRVYLCIVIACFILFVGAVVNLAVFFEEATRIGGDALNGKIENGRYYVGNHGHYVEVSESVYDHSAWRARSLAVTTPLGMLGGLVIVLLIRKEMAMAS